MTLDRLLRLVYGLGLLYAAYELSDAAFDEIGGVLGELFAESVIYPSTVIPEGESDHAD